MLFAPIVLAGLAAAAAIPQKEVVTVTQVVDCTVTLEVHSTVGGAARTITHTGTVQTKGAPSILPIAETPAKADEDTASPKQGASDDDEDDDEGYDNYVSNDNSSYKVDVSVNEDNKISIMAENKKQVVEQREDPSNPDPEAPAVPAAAAAVPVPPVPEAEKLQQPGNDAANQVVDNTQDQTEDKTGLKNKIPKVPTGEGKKKGKEEGPKGSDAPEGTGLDCKQAGDGTVFDFQAGGNPLACEVSGDSKTEKWFAVSHLYPEWADKKAICGKEYIVTYKGKTCKGKLYDKCMGCKLGDIDLSFAMWNELTDEAYPDRFQMSWAPA